jgi:hypothetical protein
MKGMVNKGIQEMVKAKFGAESWERIKREAGCDVPFFVIGEECPNELTTALVEAASDVSGLSEEEVLVEFGKFWILNTGKKTYPTFYSLAGATSREFLRNLGHLYRTASWKNALSEKSQISHEELPDGKLLIHYHSRNNLCAALRGNIIGVGMLFNQALQVRETACRKQGAEHCTMEVTFP